MLPEVPIKEKDPYVVRISKTAVETLLRNLPRLHDAEVDYLQIRDSNCKLFRFVPDHLGASLSGSLVVEVGRKISPIVEEVSVNPVNPTTFEGRLQKFRLHENTNPFNHQDE